MFKFHILKYQYLTLGLGSGIVVLLILIVLLLALKRRTPDEFGFERRYSYQRMIKSIPLLLLLIWAGVTLYAVIMTVYCAFNPPAW